LKRKDRHTTGRRATEREATLALALLCVACLAAATAPLASSTTSARQQREGASTSPAQSTKADSQTDRNVKAERTRYRLHFKLNFEARSFTGTEHLRWVNTDNRPTSVLYFHLYPNHRSDNGGRSIPNANGSLPPNASANPANSTTGASTTTAAHTNTDAPSTADEPRLEVTEVRGVASGQPLTFSLEQGTTLRVQLRESVAAGASAEIELAFRGTVPEIGADETSLSAHVIQQVGAALRDTREWRRARDVNFYSRGTMLLGTPYPLLAVREGDGWQRKVEASVGDLVHAEVADYDVSIETSAGTGLFTSGDAAGSSSSSVGVDERSRSETVVRRFAGENLRNFAIVAGQSLRMTERVVSGVRVRSVYSTEHEAVGRRVLGIAAESVRVFAARFGELPFKVVTVAEAPLVAGLGSVEFAGMGAIASAFYVDFDAPATRNLPEIVREQRASLEDSLEFAVAHIVAHQWWGASVGNDPERLPVLDEALAHWSALHYYTETHGAARAEQVLDDQLRGVYQIYRTFGGEDMQADRAAREYRNSFQYAAVVSSKGALMFNALRKLMGDERFWTALRRYHDANRFEIAGMDDLEAAFVAEVPVSERRAVTRTFNRWLSEKHGDEDVAPPNPQLAAALGITTEQNGARDRNAFSRLGRFFWRQMTRIR
jgi:hypothetical protein